MLVPLCGKSLDLIWLASKNHEVLGVELSEKACREFFSGNGLMPVVTIRDSFKLFTVKNITLFCGDFFKFSSAHSGAIGAVYDRAALIALPPELRANYASHLTTLLRECGKSSDLHFLLISREKEPHDINGPPFSVTRKMLDEYYRDTFDIRFVTKEEVDIGKAETRSFQTVYELKWRG